MAVSVWYGFSGLFSPKNMDEYLEFAKDIAYNAGKIMLKYFNESNGASYKGDKTIVTLADKLRLEYVKHGC